MFGMSLIGGIPGWVTGAFLSRHVDAILLFTFLSHDGAPWNNNIAENAIKLIASRKKSLDGLMSKDGIRDYLI
jgi:hypothetical protein